MKHLTFISIWAPYMYLTSFSASNTNSLSQRNSFLSNFCFMFSTSSFNKALFSWVSLQKKKYFHSILIKCLPSSHLLERLNIWTCTSTCTCEATGMFTRTKIWVMINKLYGYVCNNYIATFSTCSAFSHCFFK